MSSTQQTMQGDFNIDLSGFDLSDFMQSAVDPTQSMYHPHQQQQPQQPQQQQQHGSARASNGNSSNAINSNPQDHLKQFATPPQHVPMGDPAFSHSSMEPHRQQQHPSTMSHFPRGSGTAVTAESLKVQLQQQMRLQQLQQLQNQILQQQIELISGQGQSQREMLMHGLLTPTSSSELRPTVHGDYLSPMTLQAQNQQYPQDPNPMIGSMVSPAMTPQTNGSGSMSSGGQSYGIQQIDMFSPLTSPALGPTIGSGHQQRMYHHPQHSQEWSSSSGAIGSRDASPHRATESNPMLGNKRPIEDTGAPIPRKRLSPLIKATPGASGAPRRTRSSRGVGRITTGSDLHHTAMDTPSPIDMDVTMPPPAPPAGPEPYNGNNTNMEPVTPADIMNLGHRARMPTGLVDVASHHVLPAGPITAQQHQLAEALTIIEAPLDEPPKKGGGKATPVLKPKASGNRSTKPSPVIRPAGSMTPKAILPSGLSAEAANQLSQKSNYQTMLETSRAGPSSSSQPAEPAKKGTAPSASTTSSHKAAEQKRRDSLKAGFDDLRLLLPPIIIDPDSDEPLLPGSAPPRGPQRTNLQEDHPNRGVSKLALLRCSNEFIARLNKRVERRDWEIGKLREEVKWLREKCCLPGEGDATREWVDLEKDLDEVEREDPNLGTITVAKKVDSGDGTVVTGRKTAASSKTGKGVRGKLKGKEKDAGGGGIETVDEDDEE